MDPTENDTLKPEPTASDAKSVGTKIVETLDAVIDDTGDLMGGSKAAKVAGGAAIGVVAGVILPFSILTGAVIGGAYAAWRQSQRKDA
ncbi:hypothetical protein [Sphingomonas sp. SUN039]|uniref:hypothetical protein n=1 Tax=Sphingomonas sp. SUN039 TaxID=2937787 RepID=UPI002164EDBF|nr:hypothetical protein [Sphingomonas sp. SUN039]UVO53001.1 hypothetical protein M0209_02275 [Sphingomonas sp. SUN039]